MKVVLQRVSAASVSVGGQNIGSIGKGFLVLLGIGKNDTESLIVPLLEKIAGLRVFADAEGKMNRSLVDVGGALLIVSQFTLYADLSKGRRPGFSDAADPAKGKALYEQFIEAVQERGITVAAGQFGADMQVQLTNDGPVTIVYESAA